jgi:hypothetical protein
MNNRPKPAGPPPATDSAAPPVADPSPPPDQPHRPRVAALLIAAAPAAAAAALTAAPLAVAIGAPTAPHTRTTHIPDGCDVAVHSGALDTMKWPDCAGD